MVKNEETPRVVNIININKGEVLLLKQDGKPPRVGSREKQPLLTQTH